MEVNAARDAGGHVFVELTSAPKEVPITGNSRSANWFEDLSRGCIGQVAAFRKTD